MNASKPSVNFFQVADNTAKLQTICNLVYKHFSLYETILIRVSSPEAAYYIDELLWRVPEESFLPHVIAREAVKERIVITERPLNCNNAKILINLGNEICNDLSFSKIYELLDLTAPEKRARSIEKQNQYHHLGYLVDTIA